MNPKHIQAQKEGKAPLEYLVKSVWEEDARVHKHGADKYGKNNWRIDKILASTYEAAILRHYKAYFEDGEDIDPDSGESHLTHIRACCAVMRDAEMNGTLIDDRRKEEVLFNERGQDEHDLSEHQHTVPSISIRINNTGYEPEGFGDYSQGDPEREQLLAGFVAGDCDPDSAGGLR